MEREPLGIREAINSGVQNPSETAKTIARILVRDIWSHAHKQDTKNHWELNPLEQIALVALKLPGQCRQVAQKQVQESFIPSIELLIRDYTSGGINVAISGELQKMVAHAVLEIIATWVEKKWYHELAHSIHNEPNALHLLRNPTRLLLLDHGIIHGNPRETFSDKTKNTLWTGHRTNKRFEKNWKGDTNIYVEVSPKGELKPVLEGNRIVTGLTDELIVFHDNTIDFHTEPQLPEGANEGFIAPLEFSTPNTIGTFQSIIHKNVARFVGWNSYVLVGTKWEEKKEKQLVVCIRTKKWENNESFSSDGKIYTINNSTVVIENDGFYFLSQNGKEKILTSVGDIVGLNRADWKEDAVYLVANGEQQKIVIKNDMAELVKIEAGEEEFFEKKK